MFFQIQKQLLPLKTLLRKNAMTQCNSIQQNQVTNKQNHSYQLNNMARRT